MTPDKKVEPAPLVPPFVRYVASAIPMVFDDSLSYYECLAALTKYLQDVVKVINNNGAVTEEYIQLTKDMKEYMDNYFDNLDVQEEINNKLDQMALDGTLQEIITTYIQANVAWTFDTVADMKSSENLISGSYAQTLGFHTLNDGGGAIYKISDSGTANEMDVIAVDTLYANLVLKDVVNVKQTGAYGDGSHDDTAEIQRALDISKKVYVPSGTYLVDAITHIDVPSNRKLELANDAIIKAIANDQNNYAVIRLYGVDNVEICGGTIQGDRDDHIGSTGEWGQCISISNSCTNINIHDIKLTKAWGDGLYINGVTNLVTSNVIIDNARRNGISLISAENYTSNNDKITNVNGTAPEAGIDIEPNYNTDKVKNIVINNMFTSSCEMGFCASLHNLDSTSAKVEITLNDFVNKNSTDGIRIVKSDSVEGYITINNPTLIENPTNAIGFRNAQWNANFIMTVNGGYIYRTVTTDNTTASSAILIYGTTTGGNIVLDGLAIYQPGVNSGVYDFRSNATSKDISILNIKHRTNAFSASSINNIHISDDNNVFTLTTTSGAGTIGSYETRVTSIRSGDSTSSQTCTISNTAPIGYWCEFINLTNGNYCVQLPADTYCKTLSNSAAPLIVLSPYATAKITRIDSTNFIINSYSGTVAV